METMLGANANRPLSAEERRAQRERERQARLEEADSAGGPGDGDRERPADDRLLKWVDPALIGIWSQHDRTYSRLTAADCSDILATLSDGQRMPALVRPAPEASELAYELVSGARRHWAASHLGIALLVEVDEAVDDQRAFEINQVDNLARTDVAPIERARTLAWGYGFYGSVSALAKAIGMDRKEVRSLLYLAEIPDEILSAYGSELDVPASHGAALHQALEGEGARERMIEEARRIEADSDRKGRPLKPSGVLKALTDAAKGGSVGEAQGPDWQYAHQGKTFLTAARKGTKEVRMDLRLDTGVSREEVEQRFAAILEELFAQG